MLDRLAPLAHLLGMLVEPALLLPSLWHRARYQSPPLPAEVGLIAQFWQALVQ